MAKGIAEKMNTRYAVIDTEAGSASKYADRYHFVVDNLADKTIDGYIAAMHEANQAGYQVLVIDSLSHAWRELTEEVDRITQSSTSRNSFSAWGKVSPKQKRLVEAILNFPGHLITTMRSKTEWVIGQNKLGKNVPEKLGLAPEQGKGIEYEFDLLVEINQQHQAVVTKDRTGKFQDRPLDKPGEDFGIELYDWLTNGGNTQSQVIPPPAPSSPMPQMAPANANAFASIKKAVVQEITSIITANTPEGKPFFSEAEKAEGRQLISTTSLDDKGISYLKEFKDFLNGLLIQRKSAFPTQQPMVQRKAA
jgi:hypothetical protein